MGQQAKKEKKKRKSNWTRQKTRQETVKWNHTTALRFQTVRGGGGETSNIPGFPLGLDVETHRYPNCTASIRAEGARLCFLCFASKGIMI